MDNAVEALMIAFGLLVLVIALSVSVYMFSQVTYVAENLLYFSDKTNYYDSIQYDKKANAQINKTVERYVNVDTIIPTLYRYSKENFCVKIYDARDINNSKLIQVFDINLENKVRRAVADDEAKVGATKNEQKINYAYKMIYNNPNTPLYMFGAPWTGSTEDIKKRVDYFVDGQAGYINDVYVDYRGKDRYQGQGVFNESFHDIIQDSISDNSIKFKESFISYSYTGNTFINDDGDEIVTTDAKDKIVIIYTIVKI